MSKRSRAKRTFGANTVDPYYPELWAQEGLLQLENQMVMAGLVHRDFQPTIANFGDVVNAQRPSDFTAARKGVNDDITLQNAVGTNVPVALNHLVHTSFIIRDAERSMAFKDLIATFIVPAARSMAQYVDSVLCGYGYQFLANVQGKLGTALTKDGLVDVRSAANTAKWPMSDRRLVLTPYSEGDLLKEDEFTSANTVGDNGTALREAHLGRKLGFDIFMDQNASTVATGSTIVTGGEINLGAGYAVGSTSLVVDGLSAAVTAGSYITIEGDMTPHRIVSSVGGGTPTTIVITPGLTSAVVDNADLTIYTPGAVNYGPGYAAGYTGAIVINGFTVAPKVGQLIAFGTTAATDVYRVLAATTISLTVDRPLDAAIAHTDTVSVGPAGKYNLAFHRNALALVCRPLAAPIAGTGARSAVVSNNNISMRWTLAYDATKQGHIGTFDLLMGVAVLDSGLGIPYLG